MRSSSGDRSYLVCYYRAAGGSGICCDLQSPTSQPPLGARNPKLLNQLEPYHNPIIVNATNNCRTSAGGFGKGNAPGVKSRVAVVVGEVKARHRDDADGARPKMIVKGEKKMIRLDGDCRTELV